MKSQLKSDLAIALFAFTSLLGGAWFGPAIATAAPAISIVSGPSEGSVIGRSSATFRLSAVTTATKEIEFFCTLGGDGTFSPCDDKYFPTCTTNGSVKTCTDLKTWDKLASGSYTFRMFASECDSPCDPGMSNDDGPETVTRFTIDVTDPLVSLLSGPSVEKPALSSAAKFVFAASEPSTFYCGIDTGNAGLYGWTCTSPFTVGKLKNGTHTFNVRARDSILNYGPIVSRKFLVDVFKPKKCTKARSRKGKAKYRICKKSNARAKARWKKKHS